MRNLEFQPKALRPPEFSLIGEEPGGPPVGDFVRIVAPPDNQTAIGSTPWGVSSSEPAEVRIKAGTETWEPAVSGSIMEALTNWPDTAISSSYSFEARLVEQPLIDTFVTFTRESDALALTAPTPGSVVTPATLVETSSDLPREARVVVDAHGSTPVQSSAWREITTATVTLDELCRPPGGGWSIYPTEAGTDITIDLRLIAHPYEARASTVQSDVSAIPPRDVYELVFAGDTYITLPIRIENVDHTIEYTFTMSDQTTYRYPWTADAGESLAADNAYAQVTQNGTLMSFQRGGASGDSMVLNLATDTEYVIREEFRASDKRLQVFVDNVLRATLDLS